MNIYGYAKNGEIDGQLLDLSEVTLIADPSEMRSVARFILDCANEIDKDIDGKWAHAHIEDRITGWPEGSPSIVVFKANKA